MKHIYPCYKQPNILLFHLLY